MKPPLPGRKGRSLLERKINRKRGSADAYRNSDEEMRGTECGKGKSIVAVYDGRTAQENTCALYPMPSSASQWYTSRKRSSPVTSKGRAVCGDKSQARFGEGGTGDPVMGDRPLLYTARRPCRAKPRFHQPSRSHRLFAGKVVEVPFPCRNRNFTSLSSAPGTETFTPGLHECNPHNHVAMLVFLFHTQVPPA